MLNGECQKKRKATRRGYRHTATVPEVATDTTRNLHVMMVEGNPLISLEPKNTLQGREDAGPQVMLYEGVDLFSVDD